MFTEVLKGAGEFMDYIPVVGPLLHKGGDALAGVLENQETRDIQQKTWDREDNAVQRRVADLKAAGMSPVLSSGQGAQAGQPITTALQMAQQRATIEQVRAQTAKTKAETEGQVLQNNANAQTAHVNKLDDYGNVVGFKDMPAASAKVYMELDKLGWDVAKAQWETQAKALDVKIKDVEAVIAEMKKDTTYDGYTYGELETIALGLAVKQAQQQQAIAAPLVELAKSKGLNVVQIQILLQAAGLVGNMGLGALKMLK